MKKFIALLIVVILGVSLCACSSKPSKDDLMVEANRFIATDTTGKPYYNINGEYSEDYNAYYVIISINSDYYLKDYSGSSADTELYLGAAEGILSRNGNIANIVDYIFNELKDIFEDSEIDVVVGYQNIRGEFSETRTTIEQ
ncbi:MAG: hypothetical protein E7566_01500 [Ruminococcaceae bacterium]|nr:hypothetical protein [Oscillospiraceae bacterium]